MTNYERVTLKRGQPKIVSKRVYERLQELENKIENGTLRDLRCKCGDTIYYVNTFSLPPRIEKYKVYAIYVRANVMVQVDYNAFLYLEDICLTKEEAEKKAEQEFGKEERDKLRKWGLSK